MILLLALVLSQTPSPAFTSAQRARRVLADALDAIGGLATLEHLDVVTREYAGTRTDAGQNVHEWTAGRPREINGRPRITRIRNYAKGDMFDLQADTIPGGQPFTTLAVVHGDSAFSYMYDAATLRRAPPPPLPVWRALLSSEEVEGLLLAAWDSRGNARWLGTARNAGRRADVVSFTDRAQVTTAIYFDSGTHLPVKTETIGDDPIRGDVVNETRYSDWRLRNGLRLPYVVESFVNGEPLQRLRLEALRWGPVADSLFRPAANAFELTASAATATALGGDVYVMPNRYQSAFVVFDDYVLVFEPGGSPANAASTIGAVRQVAGSKPIRYVIATHAHYDHLAGARAYVPLGVTFVTTPAASRVIQRAAKAAHLLQPDSLSRHPREPIIDTMTAEPRVFRDSVHEVRLYNLGPTPHVPAMLFAYVPAIKTLLVADALDIPAPGHVRVGGEDTQRLAERIRAPGLDVERIVPVHGQVGGIDDLNAALAKRGAP
jgi:glyoxylase-like metal-dependent hydrolase (beta-lactamase superfamily II)